MSRSPRRNMVVSRRAIDSLNATLQLHGASGQSGLWSKLLHHYRAAQTVTHSLRMPTPAPFKSGHSPRVAQLLKQHHDEILAEWVSAQANVGSGALDRKELQQQGSDFVRLLGEALAGGPEETNSRAGSALRAFLEELSRARAHQGFSPTETATFVFAIKGPLFMRLREHETDPVAFEREIWGMTQVLDSLGLYTIETFLRGREDIIRRQQEDMLELSTPVVTLWEGVLALPLIGTLDSARTQVVMETLLHRIVETGADYAIIDITGVPTVDTLTAQHILKTVTAARLMGAECIISGIRPQIAQTIVHLGVDLGNVTTKGRLADAFRMALQRTGRTVVRASSTNTMAVPNGASSAGSGGASTSLHG
jgi:rsbT co-antagonist protein RsbR